MLNVELRNKTFVLLVYAGVITIVLLLIPGDQTAKQYIAPYFEGADGTGGMAGQVGRTIESLILNLLHIIKIVLWMAFVILIVRYLNFVVFNVVLRNSTQTEISSLIRSVVSIIISIVAFFIIFQSQYPNVELTALFTGSTILGIVVGLALQDTLGNLFAGIALQADQSFQVGDVINIQSNKWVGVIEQVSWRGVKIRTFQNKVVVISNAVLGKEVIEVAPKENLNARLIFFNTLYSNPPTKTIQLVRDVISKVENVSTKFRPNVRVRNLGDNGIDYEVKVWLDDYSRYNDTDALIRKRIWYAFRREGIDFAFPTRTLYIQKEKAPIDENEAITEIGMRLAEVSLFTPLSEHEMKRIAQKVMVKLFSPDEPIVKRGQEGSSMFVIQRGSVKVQVRDRGKAKVIMKLSEGDFFGEMALFTGEPRTATVIATEETEVLEITHRSLKPILEENPELVERFSEIIESRRVKLSESAESDTMSGKDPKAGVFNSIRKFFGLGKTGE
ncbi:MAG TPA: mechanosensitive ion channel family protein [Pyrinomonadaceae bacterium]|nr:mechanosensitive ion channel family protein [Pyrinomonadaceae bacterium]